jgi:hypothetical protein
MQKKSEFSSDELSAALGEWRRWLKANFGYLRSEHEDIIQDAAADLQISIKREQVTDRVHIRALGLAILRRRAVDRYRSQISRAITDRKLKDKSRAVFSEDASDTVHYQQLLQRTLLFLTKQSFSDRSLLVREVLGKSTPTSLSASDRQRLHRLRTRLSEFLKLRSLRIEKNK